MSVQNVGNRSLKLRFDDSYNQGLFAVQGDTGRKFTVQVLDEYNRPVDVRKMSLDFYVGNHEEVTKVTAERSDGENGYFTVHLVNGQLKYYGKVKSQFVLLDEQGEKIGSKIFELEIEPSIENGATVGKNVIVSFEEIDEAIVLLKNYKDILDNATEITGQLENKINNGSILNENLKKNIEKTEKLNFDLKELTGTIETAKATDNELKADISKGKELVNLIPNAETKKKELEAVISSATQVDGDIKNKMNTVQGWIDQPEQFRGEKGEKGEKGDKGDTGAGLKVLGMKNSSEELPTTAIMGDAYVVNGELWVYDGKNWKNAGGFGGLRVQWINDTRPSPPDYPPNTQIDIPIHAEPGVLYVSRYGMSIVDKPTDNPPIIGTATNVAVNISQYFFDELNKNLKETLGKSVEAKVDKKEGYGLSQNNYDNEAKRKVEAIPSNPKYTDTTYEKATISSDGLFSKEDKAKLNGIQEGANKTILVNDLTTGGIDKALSAEQGKELKRLIDTKPDSNTTYVEATGSKSGLMSATDKVKLDGIQEGANKTILVNDLTTGGISSALSAEQGKVLKTEVDTKLKTPTGGAVGNVLKKTSSGVEWGEAASQAIVKANDTNDGLMSKEDFKKLKDWNGVTSSSADANTLTAAGIYSIRSNANLPSSAGKYGSLIVLKCDTTTNNVQTDTMQVYFDQNNDIYIRNSVDKSDKTWTDWKKVSGGGSSPSSGGTPGNDEIKWEILASKIKAIKYGRMVSIYFDGVMGTEVKDVVIPAEYMPCHRIEVECNKMVLSIIGPKLNCSGSGYLGYPIITYIGVM